MSTTTLKSELKGVVSLIRDFKSEALLPVFEAVVNSVNAIDDAGIGEEGRIEVRVNALPQMSLPGLDSRKELEIDSFEIVDNGVGFNDANLESFRVVGSQYKIDKGGKGVGRFTWLKAFKKVHIKSIFKNAEGKMCGRVVDFSYENLIKVEEFVPDATEQQGTVVRLENFLPEYRRLPSACRTGKKIAQRILEHCLYGFMVKKVPSITVKDNRTNESYNLSEMFQEISKNMWSDSVLILDNEFSVKHIRFFDTNASSMHKIVLCANDREVKTISLKNELSCGTFCNEEGKRYTYTMYVSGDYLDEHVDSDRQGFDLSDEDIPMDVDDALGLAHIKTSLIERAKGFLRQDIESQRKQKEANLQGYLAENPEYAAVAAEHPEAMDEIDPNSSEDKITDVMSKYSGRMRASAKRSVRKVVESNKSWSSAEFREEVSKAVKGLSATHKCNLAEYLVYRKAIIDLLEKRLREISPGKFVKEDAIHDIIMPRGQMSNGQEDLSHNLWLLDERLTFHEFAASNIAHKKILEGSTSLDRPDIVAFSDVDDDTGIAKTIAIVEFKRPERKEYEELITEQIYRMHDEISSSKCVKDSDGRKLLINESTHYYCYAICDFTSKVEEAAKRGSFSKLPANLGYFKYNAEMRMSTYIINFDYLVADAKKRHKIFFKKLGIL